MTSNTENWEKAKEQNNGSFRRGRSRGTGFNNGKRKNLLEKADVVIYAGSLVNPELLTGTRKDCEIYNSAKMTLEEVLEVMRQASAEGKEVVRLHTGNPPSMEPSGSRWMHSMRLEFPMTVVRGERLLWSGVLLKS